MSVFSGNADSELESQPSEVALREALEQDEIAYAVSKRHWRRLAEDETHSEFVHGRLSRRLEWVRFEKRDGNWRYTGYSFDCNPTSIVGRGPVVTWSLAESPQDLAESLEEIEVDLGPGPCSGRRPQNPRARLVFRNWGRRLLMTVWLKSLPPGRYFCPFVPEPPLKVTLPRKIKLSRLYDGSTYPPTPAIERE